MNFSNQFSRLLNEYKQYGKLIIGFDFDNTIFDYGNKGGDYSEVITLLQKCKEAGFILCLYTLSLNQENLDWKIVFCKQHHIEPDYVNESPVLSGYSKPFFNILLDDRAGLESAYLLLKSVIKYIYDAELNKKGIE